MRKDYTMAYTSTSMMHLNRYLDTALPIGIWGLGVMGTSAVRYLYSQGHAIGVMDKRQPTAQEQAFLAAHNARFFSQEEKEIFFSTYTIVIPSQGIDIRPYKQYGTLWTSELDIFYHHALCPTIAITGTIGKTSVTHLLSQLLAHQGLRIATGGNIGTGLFDLIGQRADYTVLELSSSQLELSQSYAPDLAIITNIYLNHIDRHGTFEQYKAAKYQLLRMQKAHQKALIPFSLASDPALPSCSADISFFSLEQPAHRIPGQRYYYSNQEGYIVKEYKGQETPLLHQRDLPSLSYISNWIVLYAALDILNKLPLNAQYLPLSLPEHRLKPIATVRGVTFYDDSKSTIPESTIAAVNQLAPKPIVLLLGGISKGVDRRDLFPQLKQRVKAIHCFGSEADRLALWACQEGTHATASITLEAAFAIALEGAQEGDLVVLSPAGASFDLFKDYQERGRVFQALIQAYAQHLTQQESAS
jgi:UDP-N-acetylmuramoylalanine--D-glutamate ligase